MTSCSSRPAIISSGLPKKKKKKKKTALNLSFKKALILQGSVINLENFFLENSDSCIFLNITKTNPYNYIIGLEIAYSPQTAVTDAVMNTVKVSCCYYISICLKNFLIEFMKKALNSNVNSYFLFLLFSFNFFQDTTNTVFKITKFMVTANNQSKKFKAFQNFNNLLLKNKCNQKKK